MNRKRKMKTKESPQDDLKKILYDEARKLSTNAEDAKALADEAYLDFKLHVQLTA